MARITSDSALGSLAAAILRTKGRCFVSGDDVPRLLTVPYIRHAATGSWAPGEAFQAIYFLTSGQVESDSLPNASSPDIFCTTRK